VEVSSYRDPQNPELVHFPGTLASFSVLGACAAVCLFILAVLLAGSADWVRNIFGTLTCAVLAALCRAWPRRITLGEKGAWQCNILGRKSIMIPWDGMAPPRVDVELGWLSSTPREGFAANRTVILASLSQPKRVVLTPRHSGHDHFLKLARSRISRPPDAQSPGED
jgi:hypothetical protein